MRQDRALVKSAAHVTRLRVVNNRVVVASMEARAALADYDAARSHWTLSTNTQGSWLVRNILAKNIFKGRAQEGLRAANVETGLVYHAEAGTYQFIMPWKG